MTRIVAGIYPNAQEAADAAGALRRAGFAISTATDEQVTGLSGGERERVLIVTDPDDREAEVRSLFMQTGATQIQGHGSEGTGMSTTPEVSREDPVPVQQGERASTEEADSSRPVADRRSDPRAKGDRAESSEADPRYQILSDVAADPLDKVELEEQRYHV